jgi:hypothetical protein
MGSEGFDPLDERIGKTIVELRKLTRGASLQFALGVGRVVVDTLYEGDLTAWRSRARKDHALRVLAARSDLPLSASALYRALAIYELSRRQVGGQGWQHLGVSHLRVVLGLAEDVQVELLGRAETEQWTVARLEREALTLRSGLRPAGGRKPIPRYLKSIRRIFELTSPEALEGLESTAQLGASEVAELTEKIEGARSRLDQLQRRLAQGRGAERSSRNARQIDESFASRPVE